MIYVYASKHITIPEMSVPADRVAWVCEQLNEIGAKGIRVVSIADGYEPGTVRLGTGEMARNYFLQILTEEERYAPTAIMATKDDSDFDIHF